MAQQQTKHARKRKALLVLPLVVVPFMTLAFWALGGGREAEEKKGGEGLNVHLPDPRIKEARGEDKLSFYKAAEKDSLKKEEAFDAYLREPEWLPAPGGRPHFDPAPEDGEERVLQKLEQLQRQLQSPTGPAPASRPLSYTPAAARSWEKDPPFPSPPPVREDPQLEQLNAMMDKILDIQHPERLRVRYADTAHKAEPHSGSILLGQKPLSHSLLGPEGEEALDMESRFFSVYPGSSQPTRQTIGAAVHGTQTLADGGLAKFRLLQDMVVAGQSVPSGTFLYGRAVRQQGRLQVTITSLLSQQVILPVQLAVYDLDGQEGINLSAQALGNEAGRMAEQSFQQLGLSSLDPSLKAQAATAGIQTARSLLSRQVRQKRVTLKTGYRVLLRVKNQGI